MAVPLVAAEQLTVLPHRNSPHLEVTEVGLFRSIVRKGDYRTGDWAIYIPDGSVLPADLIAELGLTGKLAGRARDRVAPRWSRGELCEGLICRPRVLNSVDLAAAHARRHDFADALRITTWRPVTPLHLRGAPTKAPELIRYPQIIDLKRCPRLFLPGERVIATEKIHGTSCLYTWNNGDQLVSSKPYSRAGMALVRTESNLYWRAVLDYGVSHVAAEIATMMNADRVGIFGEIFGGGIQDLTYGMNPGGDTPGYAVFDIRVEAGAQSWWLDPDELVEVVQRIGAGLPLAPRVFDGPYCEESLLHLAEGRESVSGDRLHLREGLVIRPATERRSALISGRVIAKIVSAAYLTRRGGSEYE